MIKCPICKRQTEKGESTGKFLTIVYNNPNNDLEGTRIFKSQICCMNCNGGVLSK